MSKPTRITVPGGMSLEEIGEALGISAERVRQIEKNALRKLRRYGRMNVAKQYRQYWEEAER